MHKHSFVFFTPVNIRIRGYPLSFALNVTYRPIVSFHPFLATPREMSIILKSSKTDIFCEGHQLLITCSPSLLSAVSAMHSNILAACPGGPLFSFQFTQYLTRLAVIYLRGTACYAGLPYKSLKGHSFCMGTVTTAAAAGLPDWLIN